GAYVEEAPAEQGGVEQLRVLRVAHPVPGSGGDVHGRQPAAGRSGVVVDDEIAVERRPAELSEPLGLDHECASGRVAQRLDADLQTAAPDEPAVRERELLDARER